MAEDYSPVGVAAVQPEVAGGWRQVGADVSRGIAAVSLAESRRSDKNDIETRLQK
jgi:hypothetical protein